MLTVPVLYIAITKAIFWRYNKIQHVIMNRANFCAFISSHSKALYSYLQTPKPKVDNVAFFFWVFFSLTEEWGILIEDPLLRVDLRCISTNQRCIYKVVPTHDMSVKRCHIHTHLFHDFYTVLPWHRTLFPHSLCIVGEVLSIIGIGSVNLRKEIESTDRNSFHDVL